jgi:hypothetical protein
LITVGAAPGSIIAVVINTHRLTKELNASGTATCFHVHVVHALECDDRRDRTRPTVINAAAVVAVPVCGVEAETGRR